MAEGFGRHPDAEIYTSQPGLGVVLGARVLAEFGDDPHRYPTPRPARTTPAPRRSPAPRAARPSCWPATPATDASATRSTSGPSARSPPHPAPAPTTTPSRARGDRPPRRAAPAREPARRHPARLPQDPHPLRREHRLGTPPDRHRSLTPKTMGCLSGARGGSARSRRRQQHGADQAGEGPRARAGHHAGVRARRRRRPHLGAILTRSLCTRGPITAPPTSGPKRRPSRSESSVVRGARRWIHGRRRRPGQPRRADVATVRGCPGTWESTAPRCRVARSASGSSARWPLPRSSSRCACRSSACCPCCGSTTQRLALDQPAPPLRPLPHGGGDRRQPLPGDGGGRPTPR